MGHPCDLCHRRAARRELRDDSGEVRGVCATCHNEFEIGRGLPSAALLVVRERPREGDWPVLGLGVSLARNRPACDDGLLAVFSLGGGGAGPSRTLARHIPRHQDGRPVEFTELADHARGDRLLGVLKMDVDRLGEAMVGALDRGLPTLAHLSRRLDEFFAVTLQADLRDRDSPWRDLYTIFSGGDDLLMVGPWNVAFDFAHHVRRRFSGAFGPEGLTISAGLALSKPKRPIHLAAEEAEALLEQAKTCPAPGAAAPRDQCATLGQVWKWQDHKYVANTACLLADWVDRGTAQRGWLHTLLGLFEMRHGLAQAAPPDPTATARLAYHIARNYPPRSARDGAKADDVRTWADTLLADFDAMGRVETSYLPAALRYALAATRHPESGDRP